MSVRSSTESQPWARSSGPRGVWGNTWRQTLILDVALLSAGAATIHFAVIEPHFDEWWGFGAFFTATAVIQLLWAIAVVVVPSPLVLRVGAAGNLVLAALWAVSRTAGLPFGPEPGQPEAVALPDVAATAFELVIAAGTIAVIRLPGAKARQLGGSVTFLFAGAATLGLTVLALRAV